MLALRILVALGLLAAIVPVAAPSAQALECVSTICPPVCIVCIIVAEEVHSLDCTQTTDGGATSVTCTSWLTGTHGESTTLPASGIVQLCFHETGTPTVATCTLA